MPTQLLDDDGTASMATMIMSSHHALRRDLGCFARSLTQIVNGDRTRLVAVRDEWTRFHASLHGHHAAEDAGLFPMLRAQDAALGPAIDELEAHHKAIDPLLERGDRVFAALDTDPAAAVELVRALADLLATHLDTEERVSTPFLRSAKQFPPPPDDAAAAMYADGFAWSMAGLAPTVIESMLVMLPAILVDKLPAARAAFATRCVRAWGSEHTSASLTSVPA